jgi:hypothetical protein
MGEKLSAAVIQLTHLQLPGIRKINLVEPCVERCLDFGKLVRRSVCAFLFQDFLKTIDLGSKCFVFLQIRKSNAIRITSWSQCSFLSTLTLTAGRLSGAVAELLRKAFDKR